MADSSEEAVVASMQSAAAKTCPGAEAAAGSPPAPLQAYSDFGRQTSPSGGNFADSAAGDPLPRQISPSAPPAGFEPEFITELRYSDPDLRLAPVPAVSDGPETNLGKKAEALLQHLSEFTGLNTGGSCTALPLDFKITLQLSEFMGQHAYSLHELKGEMELVRETVSHNILSLKSELEELMNGNQRRHEDVCNHICDQNDKVSANIRSHHQDLHSKLDAHYAAKTKEPQAASAKNHKTSVPSRPAKIVTNPAPEETKPLTEAIGQEAVELIMLNEGMSPRSPKSPGRKGDESGNSTQSPRGKLTRSVSTMEKMASFKDKVANSIDLEKLNLKERSESHPLRRLIKDNRFEWLCAAVIITNAVTIGMNADASVVWAVANPGVPNPKTNKVISIMNKCYITFYTLELIAKLWVWRCDFFFGEGWKWNVFDVVLVLSGLYDVLTEFIPMNMGSGFGVTWLRVLRVVKTLKLLRVIRVMRFFQVLRLMVSSIAGSLSVLFWSILMITVMLYMFGLCFLNSITVYLAANEPSNIPPDVMLAIEAYWSSVPQAMMSLFWAVTGGADWEPLAMPIKVADTFFYMLFFLYIAFAGFAVFNILTGMFVMQTDEVAQADEETVAGELMGRHEVTAFRKHVLDTCKERPGFVAKDYVFDEIPDHFMQGLHKAFEIDTCDTQRVFTTMDPDLSGYVELEEYLKGCAHAKGSVSGLDMVLLMSETKHVHTHLFMAITYIEERLDEMLKLTTEGTETEVRTWDHRVDDIATMEKAKRAQEHAV